MRSLRRMAVALSGALVLSGLALPAAAEELKTPISATMFMRITAPVESRGAAFDAALRDPGAFPKPAETGFGEGEVLPDGSVRYGRTIVTVRNPCPPGDHAFAPPPLPGRRTRN
ncbi:MAG: hypothetical protein ACRELS_00425 [Candidatus Rokuibacteriota bacterium]